MAVLYTRGLNHVEEIGGRGFPGILFFGNDARGVVLAEDLLGQGLGVFRGKPLAGLEEGVVGFLGSKGPPVLKDELVNGQLFVFTAPEDSNDLGLALRGFPDSFPNVALINADLAGLRKVEVLTPAVPVVEGELHYASYAVSTLLVLSRVVKVGTSYVAHDNSPLQDFFEACNILKGRASLMHSGLPFLDFLASCGGKALAALGAFKSGL